MKLINLVLWASFLFATPSLLATDIQLEGLPLQLEWFDVDDDGHLDLVALMLLSQTEGHWETSFEDGKLRGYYHDETFKEKYLATWLHREGNWQLAESIALGQDTVLGFALEKQAGSQLMLWKKDALTRHLWQDGRWQPKQRLPTPGYLAGEGVFMQDFPFWQQGHGSSFWLVPDLEGLHVVPAHTPELPVFLTYPDHLLEAFSTRDGAHHFEMSMPSMISLDGDAQSELVFQGGKRSSAWRLGAHQPSFQGPTDGILIDLNGDAMADLITAEEEGEIEKRKDLPKVKTRVKSYFATAPLVFPEEPDVNQLVPGFVLTENDSDIELAEPFLDINNDGRPDLLGVAFKVSAFQLVKVVTTGRLTLKFLLHLSVQNEAGLFQPIAGGPFPMVWRINIRRLKMPTFAQITADFDGNGWVDILMEKGNRIQVTPIDEGGIRMKQKWNQSIPSHLRDPDQIYGKDLNGDGKAAFVLMKIKKNQTVLGILEPRK